MLRFGEVLSRTRREFCSPRAVVARASLAAKRGRHGSVKAFEEEKELKMQEIGKLFVVTFYMS